MGDCEESPCNSLSKRREHSNGIDPMPETQAAVGNQRVRGTALDFATLRVGDVMTLITESGSWWYFTRISGSTSNQHHVKGVMVMTNSRRFGQSTSHPSKIIVDRMVRVGTPFHVGRRGNTSDVERVLVNGAYRAG